jgi:hypothetical protein
VKVHWNKKLNPTGKGRVWSLSFTPIKSCIPNPPCKDLCFACKSGLRYPSARNAWDENLQLYLMWPSQFWADVNDIFRSTKKLPTLFRFFTSGDFVREEMVQEIINFVLKYPSVQFLIFTKRSEWLPPYKKLPANLSIVVSMWPGFTPKGKHVKEYPKAWMLDPTNPDPRIPEDAFECIWNCTECEHCFRFTEAGHVVFHKHTNGLRKHGRSEHHRHQGILYRTGVIKKRK